MRPARRAVPAYDHRGARPALVQPHDEARAGLVHHELLAVCGDAALAIGARHLPYKDASVRGIEWS